MENRKYTDSIRENFKEGGYVYLIGRVVAKRIMGRIIFLDLRDQGGTIQLIHKRDACSEECLSIVKTIGKGDIISVEGKTCFSKTGEKSILIEDCTILHKCRRTDFVGYKKTKREIQPKERYLELSVNYEKFKYYADCSRLVFRIREELYNRGFLEFDTGVLQSRFEGGFAEPFETYSRGLHKKLYLRPALEIKLKKLLASGYEKVFEIGKVFRNEGFGSKNSPEFTLLECYQAYSNHKDMMDLFEAVIKEAALKTFGKLNNQMPSRISGLLKPWIRVSFEQILQRLNKEEIFFQNKSALRELLFEQGFDLSSCETEGQIIRKTLEKIVIPKTILPTYITEIPIEAFPLAKVSLSNKEVSEGAILVVDGEFIGDTYTDENNPDVIEERLFRQSKKTQKTVNQDFVRLLKFGVPPSAGFGLGINRLLHVFRGNRKKDIRETFVFPPLK